MYLNQIILIGNLGADATFTPVGQSRYAANFRVATTKKRQAGPSRTTWFNVKLYLSENGKRVFEDRLFKGTQVFIQGEFLEDCKTTDAGTQYFRFIVAEQVHVIGGTSRPAPVERAYDELDEFPVVDGMAEDGFTPPEPATPARASAPAATPRPQSPTPPPVHSHDRHPQERRRDPLPPDPAPKRVTPLPDDARTRFDLANW